MARFFGNLFSPKYREEDFILTKVYEREGQPSKGGLVLRIEHVIKDTFACSKGSFRIENGELEWSIAGKKLINISLSNIEKKLSKDQAIEVLAQNIQKVYNKS